MTKKRIVITVTSIITVIVSAVLIYILLQSNSNEPIKPEDKKISLATLINRLEDQKIDFDNIDSVDIHRNDSGKLFVSLLKKNMSNPSQFITKEVGYIDLDTMIYTQIKIFDTEIRIFDYIYFDDTLIYSKIGAIDDSGISVEVIRDENGVITVIDQMKTLWTYDAPRFAFTNNQLYYHYKHVEEIENVGVVATLALKKYDMLSVSVIESHTCVLDFRNPVYYNTDCVRSDGSIYASNNSVYYLSTNGITSALNIYSIDKNTLDTAIFDHFVSWSVYDESTQNAILGEHTDNSTTSSKIYSYSINTKEQTEIFSKIGFSRPIVSDNKLIFLDEYSTPTLQTIILNLDTYEYQEIKGFDDIVGFPQYFTHKNTLYAIWSNESVNIQVFEIIE